jgi:hypothetical protein
MSLDDEILAGLPGERKPISQVTLRVAELLRLPGAAERWRQQCRASFQESRIRHEEHAKWKLDQKRYVRQHFPENEVADSTTVRVGWTYEQESQFPSQLRADREPFDGPLLPFSSLHRLSLADAYFVLAVIHDAERQGPKKINPFTRNFAAAQCAYYPFATDCLDAEIWYSAHESAAANLTESDRTTMDDCLALIKADLDTLQSAAQPRHSTDFRFVRWFGTEYTFTGTQAACVRVLWREWEKGTPEIGEGTILDDLEVESEARRLIDVFRDKKSPSGYHPAWGVMIVAGQTKGAYRLRAPGN